jgi:hypothetical protein
MHSLLVDICITAALAAVGTARMVYLGVSSFNQEAKEQGLTEKGYSFGSVVTGVIVGFISLFCSIFYALFVRGR